nr:P-loop NTPase fold protein [uncultured Pseudodesulfovibrio sp.]
MCTVFNWFEREVGAEGHHGLTPQDKRVLNTVEVEQMLKRNKELNVSKEDLVEMDDGELWFEDDLLDRGRHIKAITDLLAKTEGNFVMTLSSPWGTGKTSFMRMWKGWLEHNGHPCVLFNAWENDYVDNPLLSFIAEMGIQLGQMDKTGSRMDASFRKAWGFGKKIIPHIASAGTRIFLGTAVDFSGLLGEDDSDRKEAFTKISSALGDSSASYAEELLAQQITTKKAVVDFKKALGTFVNKHTEKKTQQAPMFFFVDELDRCKPTYAIELLEVIKHLFDIEGIIFVLSLDREQLGHAVRAAYGEGMDSDGYLRRFIDLEYRIPEPEKNDFVRNLVDVYGLKNYRALEFVTEKAMDEFIDTFATIGKNYSLRVMEKAFLRGAVLLHGLKPAGKEIEPRLFIPFMYLRELDGDAFDQVVNYENGEPTRMIEPQGKNLNLFENLGPELLNLPTNMKVRHKAGKSYILAMGDVSPSDLLQNYVCRYHRENNEHLVDAIKRLLDLSESLVPLGDNGGDTSTVA